MHAPATMHPATDGITVRRLDRRERLVWALGTPAKAAFGIIVSALVMWLGAVSIGPSAVVAVLIVLAFTWGMPYGWSGRLRLVLGPDGIADVRRFRQFHHPWDGGVLAWDRVGGQYGVVLCQPGDAEPVRLLAGWCPDQRTARDLVEQLAQRGWPAHVADAPVSKWWTGSLTDAGR